MKPSHSNLHYFFLLLFTLICFSSCSDDTDTDDIVPYTLVSFTYIDNNNELAAVANSVYLDENNITTTSAGYKNHGVIIVKLTEGYAAFDATCTNDVESENHVVPDGAFAVCPDCGSTFNLLQDGYPFNDQKAIYKLKEYRTSYTSEGNHATIRVYN